jgi:hypothetical protein
MFLHVCVWCVYTCVHICVFMGTHVWWARVCVMRVYIYGVCEHVCICMCVVTVSEADSASQTVNTLLCPCKMTQS